MLECDITYTKRFGIRVGKTLVSQINYIDPIVSYWSNPNKILLKEDSMVKEYPTSCSKPRCYARATVTCEWDKLTAELQR